MTLVNYQQKIIRKIIEQTERTASGRTSVEIAGIILNARAITQFLNHFQIIRNPLVKPFCFVIFTLCPEITNLHFQIALNQLNSIHNTRFGGYENACRINLVTFKTFNYMIINAFYGLNFFNFVTPKNNSQYKVGISQKNIYRIAFYPEISTVQFYFIAGVEAVNELTQENISHQFLTAANFNHIFGEVIGITDAIQARNRRNHQHITPARQQRRGGSQTEFFQFLIDGKIFFDVHIGHRQIGFGLIIIVIRHEIFNRILREKTFELAVKLGCQGFVVAQYKRWFLHLLHHIGYGKCFTRTGHTKESLVRNAHVDPVHQLPDGFRLVAGRSIWRD